MITSTSNAQVKQLIQLQKKGKLRDRQGVFVAEGLKMFREAPMEQIVKVYVSQSLYKRLEDVGRTGGSQEGGTDWEGLNRVSHEVVEDSVFRVVCDTQTPQGILCILRQSQYDLEKLLQTPAPLFLVLENLQDPGNLGTILRTAEGAGVTGVLLSRDSVDIYNPKVVRSTMGSIFRVPFLYAEDLLETLGILKSCGIQSFAAHLEGTKNYDQEEYRKGAAFLIGNESNGLSEALAAQADTYIRIPMEGQLESLNAAVAAAILVYEAYRQRR